MTSKDLREKYLDFFKKRGHVQIPAAKLVLEEDPSTLFTSSGMQPLVPYLLGAPHSHGMRLVDSQPSLRAEDADEVGDNRHTTFFEMLGNWSLGDYFKKEQIPWIFEFLTKELGISSERLYVSAYEGSEIVPKDEETIEAWKGVGIPEERIYTYGDKNWWSRSGPPSKMPIGEIGGVDSEIFYEFTEVEHDPRFGEECHPQCDCGRFMEIGNSVFIQYRKTGEDTFEKLSQQNVDFGGGLERLLAAANGENDIFKGDLHFPIIEKVCEYLGVSYQGDEKVTANLRVIADHIKAATFLIDSGVMPSNKMHGYVLRRFLRRAAVKINQIKKDSMDILPKLVDPVLDIYEGSGYFELGDWDRIRAVVEEEIKRFQMTVHRGLKEIEKLGNQEINGKIAFDLYQSYGFPPELTEELLKERGMKFDFAEFMNEFIKHRDASRTASQGVFKGGLAGHSEIETKYHTATHLLHQALRDVLGPEVFQKGSNINTERLRFDFSFDRKMTEDEIKKVEDIVNERINQDLVVDHKIVSLEEARNLNAIGLFNEKYGTEVSIYAVGPNFSYDPEAKDKRLRGGYYSLEFCGGPHVEHTGVIGGIKIEKEEAISQGVRRIRAVL